MVALLGEAAAKTSLSEQGAATWRYEEIFVSGDAYLDGLIRAIDAARHTIEFETYIFLLDSVGQRVIDALCRAAQRGVSVRVHVDGVGSFGAITELQHRFVPCRVELRVYHALPCPPLIEWLRSLPKAASVWRWLGVINRRNHRKMCLLDMREAWLGSLNVAAVHSERERGTAAWRDTGVCVAGEGVHDLRRAFERTWRNRLERGAMRHRLRERASREEHSPLVRLNFKRRQRRRNFTDLLTRIDGAEQRVWFTSAYFVPHGALLRALVRAARRGVDVRVLLPRRSDVFFMPWVAALFYEPLLQGGVRIFEYTRAMLHAKSVLIDDWALVGTSNLNQRSLHRDLEVDIVLHEPRSLVLLERSFEDDICGAAEVQRFQRRVLPAWQRLIARLGFLFRRWL